jgi:hypothetical protein
MLNSKVLKLELEVYDLKKKMKSELGYDSDLVISKEDEERLDKMNELDREKEIDARRKKRELLLERYQLLKRKQAQMQKQTIVSESDSSESSSSESSDSPKNKPPKCDNDVQIYKPSLLDCHDNPD